MFGVWVKDSILGRRFLDNHIASGSNEYSEREHRSKYWVRKIIIPGRQDKRLKA